LEPAKLVKHSIADAMREEMLSGRIFPGDRLIEGTWATRLGAAKASVREAINILMVEGFVTKTAGRSARVINLTENDVLHIYELRSGLEGLAARLVVEHGCSFDELTAAIESMRASIVRGDYRALLEADLEFHLALSERSGNPFLFDAARKVLIPFFAFVAMRVQVAHRDPEAWLETVADHEQIVRVLEIGDPFVAEQHVHRAMRSFTETGYRVWVERNSQDRAK